MAAWNKFNIGVQNLGRGVYNLNSDTLKVCLTDTLPVAANSVLADITQIAAGNGYVSGGNAVSTTAYSQVGGVGTLTGSNVTFTASGGAIAQFRYAVLYDSTASGGPLIAWFDSGAEQNLASGSSMVLQWNNNSSSAMMSIT